MNKFLNIIVLILFVLSVFGQTETGYVEIKGKVKKDGKALAAAQVIVKEGASVVTTKKTASNGKFIIKLKFDKKY